MKIFLITAAGLAVVAIFTFLYGHPLWLREARSLREALDRGSAVIRPTCVNFNEVVGLPVPVSHYFRRVLKEGQPMIAAVEARQIGSFDMRPESVHWRPFRSRQRVVIHPPGFDWDARISIFPGCQVRVHDAYIGGEGVLYAKALGLFKVAEQRGGADIARAELMRFIAEGAWYPTALLPSQGVQWKAVDARSAGATFNDNAHTVMLLFVFDDAGLIESVRAEDRGRIVGNSSIPTPCHGRFRDYQERAGMTVPLAVEVAWDLPRGAQPYWRGQITGIKYDLTITSHRESSCELNRASAGAVECSRQFAVTSSVWPKPCS
jgi:hypothetical protein